MSEKLSRALNQIYAEYHRPDFLSSDPLEYVHQYQDPWDQEVVAILAAVLAYGNRIQIRASIERVLKVLEEISGGPASFIRTQALRTDLREPHLERVFEPLYHRFNTGRDLRTLFALIAMSWKTHGSVGAHFLSGLHSEAPSISAALDRLMETWKTQARDLPEPLRAEPSFSYLLTAPRDGSACKRWCMLLRWMGRRDGLDVGLWAPGSPLWPEHAAQGIRASQLIFPLDTHTWRIAQKLKLTRRKTLNWRTAEEVTERFKDFCPEDPVKYDFSLCRTGMFARK